MVPNITPPIIRLRTPPGISPTAAFTHRLVLSAAVVTASATMLACDDDSLSSGQESGFANDEETGYEHYDAANQVEVGADDPVDGASNQGLDVGPALGMGKGAPMDDDFSGGSSLKVVYPAANGGNETQEVACEERLIAKIEKEGGSYLAYCGFHDGPGVYEVGFAADGQSPVVRAEYEGQACPAAMIEAAAPGTMVPEELMDIPCDPDAAEVAKQALATVAARRANVDYVCDPHEPFGNRESYWLNNYVDSLEDQGYNATWMHYEDLGRVGNNSLEFTYDTRYGYHSCRVDKAKFRIAICESNRYDPIWIQWYRTDTCYWASSADGYVLNRGFSPGYYHYSVWSSDSAGDRFILMVYGTGFWLAHGVQD